MTHRQTRVLACLVIAFLARVGVVQSWAADTVSVLSNEQAFHERFNQDQGHHRLALLVDPG